MRAYRARRSSFPEPPKQQKHSKTGPFGCGLAPSMSFVFDVKFIIASLAKCLFNYMYGFFVPVQRLQK